MTHEQGIVRLARAILDEHRQLGGKEGWLVEKFTDVATTWAASGWSQSQIETGVANLCTAVEAWIDLRARGAAAPAQVDLHQVRVAGRA